MHSTWLRWDTLYTQKSSSLHWLPASFNPSSTLLPLHQPSPHPSISLNDLLCPWSPPCFTPSTSTSTPLSFSLRPPPSHRCLSLYSLSGLCRHISPPHLVSFPLTLEQMAGPCSLCVSLTDRGWSSASIDDQSYAAPLRLSSPSFCPLTLLFYVLLQTSSALQYSILALFSPTLLLFLFCLYLAPSIVILFLQPPPCISQESIDIFAFK